MCMYLVNDAINGLRRKQLLNIRKHESVYSQDYIKKLKDVQIIYYHQFNCRMLVFFPRGYSLGDVI